MPLIASDQPPTVCLSLEVSKAFFVGWRNLLLGNMLLMLFTGCPPVVRRLPTAL